MAVIVDKVQKRRDIAFSCKGLVLDKGIKNITISEIAKTAGIGKGSVYDYFKNKEDLVFELVNIMLLQHYDSLIKETEKLSSAQEKIKSFFKFFYKEEDIELRTIYKEFIAISLSSPNEEMVAFQSKCSDKYYQWFDEIIQNAINENEISPQAKSLLKGIFVSGEGMFITATSTNQLATLEKDINEFIDAIFKLLEIK